MNLFDIIHFIIFPLFWGIAFGFMCKYLIRCMDKIHNLQQNIFEINRMLANDRMDTFTKLRLQKIADDEHIIIRREELFSVLNCRDLYIANKKLDKYEKNES